MKLSGLTKTTARCAVARWAAGLLVAAGLAAGTGIQPASADDEIFTPPTVLSLRLDAPEAEVTFRDNSDPDYTFLITLRERDNPDRIAVQQRSPGGVPGVGRVTTRLVSGIKPGVAYCVRVQAVVRVDDLAGDIFGLENPFTDESNAVCADPNSQRPPDLVLENVRGGEEKEWAKVSGQSPAYLVVFSNDGADASGTVVVDIATSGVAVLAQDQALVRPGWAANGFTCVAKPAVAGSTTGGLRCTGGSLKQGERTNPAILVRFTGRGFGHIHASISVSGSPAETDTRDNAQTLNVRVY